MVFTEHFPDNAGALSEGPIVAETQFMHRVENATVDGLETITGIGQGTTDDDAHGVL